LFGNRWLAANDVFEMEQRWLALARCHEFTERVSRFIGASNVRDDKKARS